MSEFNEKKRSVRIQRAKATVRRAEIWLGTHSTAQAAGIVRELRDMLKECASEMEFPTATGDSQYG